MLVKKIIEDMPFSDKTIPFGQDHSLLLPGCGLASTQNSARRVSSWYKASQGTGTGKDIWHQSCPHSPGIIHSGNGWSGVAQARPGNICFVQFENSQEVKLTGIVGLKVPKGTESRLLSLDIVPVRSLRKEFFNPSSSKILARYSRLRMIREIPLCYTVNYVPELFVNKIRSSNIQDNTMLEILINKVFLSLGDINQAIRAVPANNETAAQLKIEPLAPVMYVETFAYDDKDQPIVYSQIFYRGDQSKYNVEIHNVQNNSQL